jgi:hypothetical protein
LVFPTLPPFPTPSPIPGGGAAATGGDPLGALLLFALVVVGFVCFLLALNGAVAFYGGERLWQRTATRIDSLHAGRVVVSGIAEPAWCILRLPFSEVGCLWYYANSSISMGKGSKELFREVNAVPFVLNDGSGKVLVLGRRARWDGADGYFDERLLGEDSDGGDQWSRVRVDEWFKTHDAEPPGCLEHSRDDSYDDAEILQNAMEQTVVVGERVTVVGYAYSAASEIIGDNDDCADDGQSLGLPGIFAIGPRPRGGGLYVLAGDPNYVTRRSRANLILGFLGGVGAVMAVAAVFVLLGR